MNLVFISIHEIYFGNGSVSIIESKVRKHDV